LNNAKSLNAEVTKTELSFEIRLFQSLQLQHIIQRCTKLLLRNLTLAGKNHFYRTTL